MVSNSSPLRRFAWVIAALTLLLGYLDLIRGGITLSAILLTLGYCAAVPWAIMAGAGEDVNPVHEVTWKAALLAGGSVLALYLLTLAPSTAMWDTSEYIAAAYTFGLPHPPGNPMFVILGRFFSILPIAPNVAMRVNLLAAISSAVSTVIWFLVAERVAARWGLARWARHVAGAVTVLLGATAYTVWSQSVVNEKVYTVSLVGIAIISWLMLRWIDRPEGPAADRQLVLVAYILGLGYANHMAGMLPLPAAGLAVLLTNPRVLLRWRTVLAAVLAMMIGLTPFATQPIRSAHQPPLNEGEPTACRDGLAMSCTFSQGTWKAFTFNFNRGQYGKPSLVQRQAPFSAQLGMWWLYFRWQWLRDADGNLPRTQAGLAALFFVLAFVGGAVHFRHDRPGFRYFGTLMALTTVVLIYYLNFRYGASQSPGLDVPREVRDRDYFFLWSFSAWGVWAGLGLVWAWHAVAALLSRVNAPALASRRALLATTPLLAVACVPLVGNWRAASRRGDYSTVSFARDLLNSVEPYGVLITAGDNDTFPLWYAQYVEGIRKDVTVGVLSLMNTDWYARAMIRQPTHDYDAERGPAVYRGRTWTRPTTPPLQLTLEQADSIPELLPVSQPLQFAAPGINVTIEPQQLPKLGETPYLERADLLVLRMVADGTRPIYISRTAGNYAERLGLGMHTVSQGLARKVVPAPTGSPDTVFVPGSGWFDLQRSRDLWKEFRGPAAVTRYGRWIDQPSLSTIWSYLLAGGELSDVLRHRGFTAQGDSVFAEIRALAAPVGLAQYLQPAAAPPPPVPGGDTGRAATAAPKQ